VVNAFEDDGICFKVHVEDPIREGQVETRRKNDEFEEEHAKRTCQCYGGHLFPTLLFEFDWSENIGIASRVAEVGCAASEEDRAVGFGEED